MRPWLRRIAFVLALLLLVLTLVNASWLAPEPKGAPKMIAHRGLAQVYAPDDIERDTCTATRIGEPYHDYLENTLEGAARVAKLGAAMIEVDIAPTSDGEIVVFHDWTLDCRTDGTGNLRDATLEELKALDIGYGYSADGGESFPFRGEGVGAMPTIGELLAVLPDRSRVMYNFKSGDAAEADLLARKLRAAGRDPVASRDGFYGDPAPVARIEAIFPGAWTWVPQQAADCSRDYVLLGWTGYLPASCRGKTMVIPLNYQFPFWGWPNRLIARMEEHGGEVIVTGPYNAGDANRGLTLPEQLGEIPDSFNGYVWVEDGFTVIPAYITRFDDRSQEEIDAAEAALARRRAAQ